MDSGTIRGDYALAVGRNICHGSDSVESAEKEIALYVTPNSSCLHGHITCSFSAGSPMVSRRMFLSLGLDDFFTNPVAGMRTSSTLGSTKLRRYILENRCSRCSAVESKSFNRREGAII